MCLIFIIFNHNLTRYFLLGIHSLSLSFVCSIFLLSSINFKLTNLCWMQMLALENQYHNELQLELQGVQYSSSVSNMNKQSSVEDAEAWEESLPNMQQIAEDTTTMSKVVMSRKKRRLYEAMQVTLLTPIMLLYYSFLTCMQHVKFFSCN